MRAFPKMPDSTTTDTPDLVASTGVNDANSPWNGLLVTALQSGLQAGTTALTSALQSQTPVNSATGGNGAPLNPSAPQTPITQMAHGVTSYVPWIIGGVLLIVAGWFLFGKK